MNLIALVFTLEFIRTFYWSQELLFMFIIHILVPFELSICWSEFLFLCQTKRPFEGFVCGVDILPLFDIMLTERLLSAQCVFKKVWLLLNKLSWSLHSLKNNYGGLVGLDLKFKSMDVGSLGPSFQNILQKNNFRLLIIHIPLSV